MNKDPNARIHIEDRYKYISKIDKIYIEDRYKYIYKYYARHTEFYN